MNRLSDRLQVIADRINEGETMADIGTDHGFLPVYLVENNISPATVMADVSAPSLEKGRRNAHMTVSDVSLLKRMDFRVGDGLQVLEDGEVDVVVIAGMGGKLIRDIMAADYEHTCSFRKFILQPRIGQGHLRKWMTDNGFVIINEAVAVEGAHIPEIITALTPANAGEHAGMQERHDLGRYDGDDIMWKLPPWITGADGPVEKLIDRNIDMARTKLDNVKKARVRNFELEKKIIDEISYLKGLLKEREDVKGKRNC